MEITKYFKFYLIYLTLVPYSATTCHRFPIDDIHQNANLRSASDFASQLNIHFNHLNRAVKDTAEKTTTQIIAERTLQEARALLKRSIWSVSEIAYALGFREVTHFNNFFKKHIQQSPLKFRNVWIS